MTMAIFLNKTINNCCNKQDNKVQRVYNNVSDPFVNSFLSGFFWTKNLKHICSFFYNHSGFGAKIGQKIFSQIFNINLNYFEFFLLLIWIGDVWIIQISFRIWYLNSALLFKLNQELFLCTYFLSYTCYFCKLQFYFSSWFKIFFSYIIFTNNYRILLCLIISFIKLNNFSSCKHFLI